MLRSDDNFFTVNFSIKYATKPGQNIYVLGNLPQLGNWKETKLKLKWTEGHLWKGNIVLEENLRYFSFKYVCFSDDGKFKRWEEGPDRIFDRTKFPPNDYDLFINSIWNHLTINFNIYYPLNNEEEYMQIVGDPKNLGNWFKNGGSPLRMHLSEEKTLEGIFTFKIRNNRKVLGDDRGIGY
jgi:hypothetical protein